MYNEITKCRVCGSSNIKTVFDLGTMAITGIFKSAGESVEKGPVQLVQCQGDNSCGLIQLRQSYSPEEMYGATYGYRSGLNRAMVDHLKKSVLKIRETVKLNDHDTIIDIGSNDGTMLSFYEPGKYKLVGVDPSADAFREFYRNDTLLICDFFKSELLRNHSINKAKIITSFSMFYDLEDPVKFACDIYGALSDDGVWVFEQSYLLTMLQSYSFDTVCHEHLEYYSIKQIQYILDKANLKIFNLELNETNGGSVVVWASKKDAINTRSVEIEVFDLIHSENSFLAEIGWNLDQFKAGVMDRKKCLLEIINQLKSEGKRVCGLGASTKGNVLLQYYGLDSSIIDFVGEVNPVKFGKVTPGSNIPIISEDELLKMDDIVFLVLPWHFKDFFKNSEKFAKCDLIFPLPDIEIRGACK